MRQSLVRMDYGALLRMAYVAFTRPARMPGLRPDLMLTLRPILLTLALAMLAACDVGIETTPPDPPTPTQTRVVRLTLELATSPARALPHPMCHPELVEGSRRAARQLEATGWTSRSLVAALPSG